MKSILKILKKLKDEKFSGDLKIIIEKGCATEINKISEVIIENEEVCQTTSLNFAPIGSKVN